MQIVSDLFTERAASPMQPLFYKAFISFSKEYDPAAEFFTIGTSSIGSNDPLRGTGSVIQEWDKYPYEDISDRVISIEYNRETEPPTNTLTLATATLVLDNHDDIFTPTNADGPYYGLLVPKRPVKLQIGYGSETVQVFVGLTQGQPEINERSKTVTFRCLDFLSFVLNKTLDETELFINKRSDEIVKALLEAAGIGAVQMDLDVGTTVIPFAFFDKGEHYRDAIHRVVQAELGNLSMSEEGVVTFRNRISWADNQEVWQFTKDDDMLEFSSPTDREIINVVEVKGNPRRVEDKQKVWDMDGFIQIPGNSSYEEFIDFVDKDGNAVPVTAADEPEADGATSIFEANQFSDGSGVDRSGDVSVTEFSLFSTRAKIVLENTSSDPLYITRLEIYGTPALPIHPDGIYERVADDASIGEFDGYDEQPFKIENDLIQDAAAARTIGMLIILDRAEIDDQRTTRVKGVPQLQIGDVVRATTPETDETYFVTRINGILNRSSGFTQTLALTKRVIRTFYRVGFSSIGGADQLGP